MHVRGVFAHKSVKQGRLFIIASSSSSVLDAWGANLGRPFNITFWINTSPELDAQRMSQSWNLIESEIVAVYLFRSTRNLLLLSKSAVLTDQLI